MLQPDDQIDIWVIEKALGSGGMGSVYRCHNRNASRILAAVKVLDSSLRKYPEAEARFIREAEILFQLDHPNIVKVRNVRTDIDPPYLEMEFVEGESVEQRLRRGALSYEHAIEFMEQITSALAYLHKKGVRHRDIKPANLLITDQGRVKLVDFGLAMEADATRITQTGMTFGTVSYAPPEWIAPDTLDPARWDLYACGIVFYEILTGELAFPVSGQGSARQQAMQVIVGKQGHEPLDPGEAFHEDVRSLVRDMTHSDASKRLSSAAEAVRRARALGTKFRQQPGVTLAPMTTEDWEDGLDVTPEPKERPKIDTWMSTDVGAPTRGDEPEPPPGVVTQEITRPPVGPAPPPAPSTGSITLEPRSVGMGMGIAATALAGLLGLALIGGSIGAYLWLGKADASRDVEIAITGLPADAAVDVQLDGTAASTIDGQRFRFSSVPLGTRNLAWAVGAECEAAACAAGSCPPWCGSKEAPIEVVAGSDTQVLFFDIPPPETHPLDVLLPTLEGDWPLSFEIDGTSGTAADGKGRFDNVGPGKHTLTVAVGTCDEAAIGCWPDGDCPDGCTSYRGELVVPWGDIPKPATIEIVAPVPLKGAAPGPRPTPRPGPSPTPEPPPSSGSGSPVTVGQFAGWLKGHEDWQAEAAIAAGRAKNGYLKGWTGASPPGGVGSGEAMTNISWFAASAYCKSRGGLAGINDEPTRWGESASQPYIELRVQAGNPAWRSSDGRDSTALGGADVQALTGFRCSR